ncbi:MAG: NAD(P)H-dependent oxidoreductase subunit E [Candidatus Gastranaerophilaceae bacterium]|jgi:NADH-quinone oxidoreductase subunit E
MSSYINLPNELIEYTNKWKNKKGSLIMILHAVQDFYGYVPKDICFTLAKELKVPLARIYEVLTFYNYFKLESSGKYKIAMCMGTACYLKGAPEIIKVIEDKLHIIEGQTSKDGLFTLEHVRCMGCCGLAPVVRINEKIYGKLNKDKILNILDEYAPG